MITLIKLGGSLITDKNSERSFNAEVVNQIAQTIQKAKQSTPTLKIIIGHGSGSFGHFEAKRHNTIYGYIQHKNGKDLPQLHMPQEN